MYEPDWLATYDRLTAGESSKERVRRRREQAKSDCKIIALLAVIDSIAWAMILSTTPPLAIAGGALHGAVILFLVWRIKRCSGDDIDIKYLCLALALTVLIGPVGLTLAVLVAAGALTFKKSREKIDAWYRRLADTLERDKASTLYDSIYHRREVPITLQDAESFLFMMNEGTFSQRQAILGIVAQKYRPELLPVLKTALNCPVAALRVQAAAVKGKLHAAILDSLKEAVSRLETSQNHGDVAAAGRRLWQCIESGLLEEDQKLRAFEAAAKVHDVARSVKYTDVEARRLYQDLQPLLTFVDEQYSRQSEPPFNNETPVHSSMHLPEEHDYRQSA